MQLETTQETAISTPNKSSPEPAHNADFFDAMFRADADADPWHFRSRWYELRKRDLTLACLPGARYSNAYEPGCANGELSAALATRCDRLLCSDGSALAVQAARRRLAEFSHAEVSRLWLPAEWPDETFDLIVLSEVGYYLSLAQLQDMTLRVTRSLAKGGTVLACHWRHPIDGCAMRGDDIHDALNGALGLPHLCAHVEADFRLDVWSRDGRSVARRENLV